MEEIVLPRGVKFAKDERDKKKEQLIKMRTKARKELKPFCIGCWNEDKRKIEDELEKSPTLTPKNKMHEYEYYIEMKLLRKAPIKASNPNRWDFGMVLGYFYDYECKHNKDHHTSLELYEEDLKKLGVELEKPVMPVDVKK